MLDSFRFKIFKKDQLSTKQGLLENNNKENLNMDIKIILFNKVFIRCIHLQ